MFDKECYLFIYLSVMGLWIYLVRDERQSAHLFFSTAIRRKRAEYLHILPRYTFFQLLSDRPREGFNFYTVLSKLKEAWKCSGGWS